LIIPSTKRKRKQPKGEKNVKITEQSINYGYGYYRTTVMVTIVAVVLVGLAGCSQIPTNSSELEEPTLLKRSTSSYKPTGDSLYTETIMSAEHGGTLALWDVELYFPPDALDSDTLISITIPDAEVDTLISITIPDAEVFENRFGTDGLEFDEPVRVIMNYRDADLSGVNESTIKMAWYNERTRSWNIIYCSLDIENKTVTAYVNHFSAYALISD